VAFVGGGGKTTAMFRLAAELANRGQHVITTTTTRLGADQLALAPIHLCLDQAEPKALEEALNQNRHVLVTGPIDPALGKATGVPAGQLKKWSTIPNLAAILIEADGAQQRPFKAPAEHEPAIPTFTSLVVIVVGLDALGQPLGDSVAHRPERVAALTGLALGQAITPEIIGRVIVHPLGGLKNVPAGALLCVLLNKAETPHRLAQARTLAARLLQHPIIKSVLIGSVRADDPIHELHTLPNPQSLTPNP
jgi:molybdenum cofactor cytidylyltransferase